MVYTMNSPTRPHVQRCALRDAHEYIAVRADFTAGSMHGHNAVTAIRTGELPAQYHQALNDALLRADTFVVMSYETPIAWFSAGLWFMPDVGYSVTTSKHQAQVKRAIEEGNREQC